MLWCNMHVQRVSLPNYFLQIGMKYVDIQYTVTSYNIYIYKYIYICIYIYIYMYIYIYIYIYMYMYIYIALCVDFLCIYHISIGLWHYGSHIRGVGRKFSRGVGLNGILQQASNCSDFFRSRTILKMCKYAPPPPKKKRGGVAEAPSPPFSCPWK